MSFLKVSPNLGECEGSLHMSVQHVRTVLEDAHHQSIDFRGSGGRFKLKNDADENLNHFF